MDGTRAACPPRSPQAQRHEMDDQEKQLRKVMGWSGQDAKSGGGGDDGDDDEDEDEDADADDGTSAKGGPGGSAGTWTPAHAHASRQALACSSQWA